jgi:hypothetical protein
MAQNQNSSDFLLPPQFFTFSKNDTVSTTLFPNFITSPTVTEQQQQHITELTCQMTHSSLHHKLALNNHHKVTTNNNKNK